jgi:periplasmic copper chaperone A
MFRWRQNAGNDERSSMRLHIKLTKILALAGLALLAACGGPPELYVDDVVLRLSPVDSNPSAFYFTVHGGAKDVYLMTVVSESAIRTEMHESSVDPKTGAMAMAPLDRVLIPAKGKVVFAKGGKHVMVWGINQVARRLGEIRTDFVFSNGERIRVNGVVQEMDGSIPDEKKAIS